MIINTLDKVVFGSLLLLAFQIPILSDHYLQFINGYYESTKQQVEGFRENAMMHEYADEYVMIEDLLNNPSPVVRTDAAQKQQTMQEYEQLKLAVTTLKNGNIFQKSWFMFKPDRWASVKKVLENFKPSIPLSFVDIIYSALMALLLSMIIMWPVRALATSKANA